MRCCADATAHPFQSLYGSAAIWYTRASSIQRHEGKKNGHLKPNISINDFRLNLPFGFRGNSFTVRKILGIL